jgi:hypothetical protein
MDATSQQNLQIVPEKEGGLNNSARKPKPKGLKQ